MRKGLGFLVERRRLLRDLGLLSLLGVLVVELWIPSEHGHFWFERTFGFWALFGFVGGFVLAKTSKAIAHLLLSKPEDFYGEW